MLRVGLTGGIASGKSTVCKMLEDRGCIVIDADKVAHDLILKGKACYTLVLEAFGKAILGPGGKIDRKKLGSIVFEDPARLEVLNQIVHPAVIRQILHRLDIMEREQPRTKAVVDASLMIESGFYKSFQGLIVVVCTLDQQIERLVARNGLSEKEARQRISLQMPLEQKTRFADYVIDSSGSLENTEKQAAALFEKLVLSS